MNDDMIIPGQPQGNRRMSYEELEAEVNARREDQKYYEDEISYYKTAMAQDAAWSKGPAHTAKERLADRLLDQQVPKDQKPVSEELYITRSKLFELLALIPSLARKDARRFVRDWEDIETLAQGGGNEQIVKTRQERLLFELQIARSIGDAPITGMTTASMIITDRVESDQKINMPPQRKPQGWMNALTGGGNQ